MPSMNFRKQFADAVASGRKTQSIQVQRLNAIKVGDKLHLYSSGFNHKDYRVLGKAVCADVCSVTICPFELRINGYAYLLPERLDEQARLEGYADWNDMRSWFSRKHLLPFNGVLIRWRLK